MPPRNAARVQSFATPAVGEYRQIGQTAPLTEDELDAEMALEAIAKSETDGSYVDWDDLKEELGL